MKWLAILLAGPLPAQQPDDRGVYRIGSGVSAPTPTKKPDPKYSKSAENYCVQGSVILRIVINSEGTAGDIKVVSGIGFDLDEEAVKAIREWRFQPGRLNGVPVAVFANVEVNFRLSDSGPCKERNRFESALRNLKPAPTEPNPARDEIVKMKDKNYPTAQYLVGRWMLEGSYFPKDPTQGLELIRKAAEGKSGPALALLGDRVMKGIGMPADEQRGWSMMTDAARYGSPEAMYLMGVRSEESDSDKASAYFQQCASLGQGPCEFRLGRLMARDAAQRVQAIAWLGLAVDQKVDEAKEPLAQVTALANPQEIEQAKALKQRLSSR